MALIAYNQYHNIRKNLTQRIRDLNSKLTSHKSTFKIGEAVLTRNDVAKSLGVVNRAYKQITSAVNLHSRIRAPKGKGFLKGKVTSVKISNSLLQNVQRATNNSNLKIKVTRFGHQQLTKAEVNKALVHAKGSITRSILKQKLKTARPGYTAFIRQNIGKGFIYKATDRQTGKVYIGQTVHTVNQRISQHFAAGKEFLTGKKKYAAPFDKLIAKKGRSAFKIQTIATVKTRTGLDRAEKRLITKFKATTSGLNTSKGRRPLALKSGLAKTKITKTIRKR